MSLSSWLLASTVLILGLTLLWREYRNRKQVRALIARLNEIEVSPEILPDQLSEDTSPEPATGDDMPHPTADILHGKTSYVERVLAGGRKCDLPKEEQAILAIHEHLTEAYSPAMLAEDLHISLRTLERGISESLGCSPSKLIVAVKMREAYRLIADERLTVTAVSYRLGFSSPSHFSRRFKSFYRISPSEVRHREQGR